MAKRVFLIVDITWGIFCAFLIFWIVSYFTNDRIAFGVVILFLILYISLTPLFLHLYLTTIKPYREPHTPHPPHTAGDSGDPSLGGPDFYFPEPSQPCFVEINIGGVRRISDLIPPGTLPDDLCTPNPPSALSEFPPAYLERLLKESQERKKIALPNGSPTFRCPHCNRILPPINAVFGECPHCRMRFEEPKKELPQATRETE